MAKLGTQPPSRPHCRNTPVKEFLCHTKDQFPPTLSHVRQDLELPQWWTSKDGNRKADGAPSPTHQCTGEEVGFLGASQNKAELSGICLTQQVNNQF